MKQTITFLLVVFMLLSLTSCGNDSTVAETQPLDLTEDVPPN